MTRRSWTEVGLSLALLGAASEVRAAQTGYAGSPAEQKASAAGRKLLKELSADLTGDGKAEVAVVEQLGRELRVVILEPTGSPEVEGGFRRVAESAGKPGQRVVRLEAARLVGSSANELVAVLEDPSPDETGLTVRIWGTTRRGLREIFAHTFFLPARGGDKEAKEVSFGDASPHFTLEDVDGKGDGDKEIVWVKEAQTLSLPGKDGDVRFVIGAIRTVFRFDAEKGEYVVAAEGQSVDFLPPKPPSDVEASAQVAKIWGTAQAFWAADEDLGTSWNVASKGAVGAAVTARWRSTAQVSMIRVVPGCGGSVEEWDRHDRVQAFRILLGSGKRFEIDRRKLVPPPPGVKALGEFPLEEGFGGQLLIFLEEPQELPWARLEILKVERSKRPPKQAAGEVCVSELSFH